MSEDPQQIWDEYYASIRRRRTKEAQILHARMTADGVDDSTALAIDCRHFGNDEQAVRDLATQLSENYTVSVARQKYDENYWLLDGTTRPDGVDAMTEERCAAWAAFMCDVAQSYNLLESYVDNFAACIKRFAGGNNG